MTAEQSGLDPYTPIDCNAYDELTVRIMRGQRCSIRFRDAAGVLTAVFLDPITDGHGPPFPHTH